MTQKITLTYSPSLPTPTLHFFDEAGATVGDVAGYALTEVPVDMGRYQVDVPDAIEGNPLLAVLKTAGVFESSDFVKIEGTAGSSALVGNYSAAAEAAVTSLNRVTRGIS